MRVQDRWLTIGVAALAVAALGAAGQAEVLGEATAALEAADAREGECSLGNVVADAARSAVGADAAFVQASQLRSQDIPAGKLTRETLVGALLYPDERVVLAELTGAQIEAALERSLSMLPKPSTSLLQVSAITVGYRSDAPGRERVDPADVRVDGKPLSLTKRYRVAMPDSLAKGALGYFRIFGEIEPELVGPPLGDALADYVRTMRVVSPTVGRLRDLSESAG